jgi:hypothetical protein
MIPGFQSTGFQNTGFMTSGEAVTPAVTKNNYLGTIPTSKKWFGSVPIVSTVGGEIIVIPSVSRPFYIGTVPQPEKWAGSVPLTTTILTTSGGGVLKRWTGTIWEKGYLNVYNSGSFVNKPMMRFDSTSSAWLTVNTTKA